MAVRQPKKTDMTEIIIYGIIALVGLYLCMALGACFQLNQTEQNTVDFVKAFDAFESTVTDVKKVLGCLKVRGGWCIKLTLFGAFAEGIYILMKATDKKRYHQKGVEHGSARWGTDKEKKALADKPGKRKLSDKQKAEIKRMKAKGKYIPDNNIILTKDIKMSLDTRQTRKNLNVMVFGSSGSGKSRFYVKPNAMQANTSYVFTDPKGELLQSTAHFLMEQGYEIKVFNLIDMTHSMNYNPFNYIYDVEGNYSETAVIKMINVLMQNTKKEGTSGGDQFWDDSTQLLLSALAFYLIEIEDEENRNFGNVIKLLKLAEVKEGEEDFQSDLDLIFDSLEHPEKYQSEEAKNSDKYKELGLENIISQEKRPSELMCLKYYNDFKKAAGDTLKSIIISVAVRLQAFNLPKVRDLTCCDNLELNLLGDTKTALYVIIPSSDRTFNFLAAMMYTQLFDTLYDRANFKYGGRLPVHVRCMFDEFANTGKIPNFQELLATMRSMEISANIILQNLSQLKAMYEKEWESLIGNCDTTLFLGGQEQTTLEYLSKRLGKETIDTLSHSRSRGRSSSSSTNDGILGRELMTIDEMGVMKDDECLLFVRGNAPFFSKKFVIEKHKNYKKLGDYKKKFEYGAENFDVIKAKELSPEEEAELYTETVEVLEEKTISGIASILSKYDNSPDELPTAEDEIPDEVTVVGDTVPYTSSVGEEKAFSSENAEMESGDTAYTGSSQLNNLMDDMN